MWPTMASRPKIDDAEPLLADARRARASRVVLSAESTGGTPADDKTLCRIKILRKKSVTACYLLKVLIHTAGCL